MKKRSLPLILSTALILSLVLSLGQRSFAGPWPELETDQQKLEYGLALRAKIKPFFTGTFNYGMEWWNITSDQQKMKQALAGLYPRELDNRPLSLITLNRLGEQEVPSPEQLQDLKETLLQYLSHKPQNYTKNDLIQELKVRSLELLATKPGELLAVLLNSVQMPKEDRPALMKASVEEKLAYIKAHFPDDLSETTIAKSSKNKYTPESLGSKTQAVRLMERLFQYEKDSLALVSLALASDRLAPQASRLDMERAVTGITYNQFVSVQNDETSAVILKKALRTLPNGQGSDAQALEVIKWNNSVFNKGMQKLTANGSKKIVAETPYLQLAEKSRDEAIMRSAVGNDCTHTCSFTKADDPNSRVFYLVDLQQNKEIGYVEAEIKSSSHGDVLYVTSINGPTITPEQAEDILQMLHSHRREIGVAHVAIASRNLQLFMNYGEVISYLERKVDGKPRIQIHSKNPRIASVIDGFLKVDYQKESENGEAVIYTPESEAQNTKSSYRQVSNNSTLSRPVNPKEALLFALELDSTERWLPKPGDLSDGERAIVAAKMDLQKYRQLRIVLQNHQHLTYEKSLEISKAALAPYQIELDKAFVNDHPHLFYDALLASSDALEGTNRKATLRLIAQMIKRGIWHATWGMKEFGKNPQNVEAINQSKELEDVMKWAIHDLGFHSIQVRNMVTAGIGFPLLRQPENTKELFRLVAHGHMWAPDLSTEILKAIYPDLAEKIAPQYARDPDSRVRDGAMKILSQAKPKVSVGQKTSPKVAASGRPGLCSKVYSH